MTRAFAKHPPIPDIAGAKPDWAAHNAGLSVEFSVSKVERSDGTTIDREVAIIHAAGDTLTSSAQPVDDALRERFKDAYDAWKHGRKQASKGFPVEEWPVVNSRQAAEMHSVNIFTIEQLASLSDGFIHNLPNGRELRDKAKAWLKTKETTDLAAENAKLLARIDALERMAKRGPLKQPSKSKNAEARARISEVQREIWAKRKAVLAAADTHMSEPQPPLAPEILPPAE